MTLISKTAGALSVMSCVHDIHKTALIYSNNEYAKTAANTMISSSIDNQKSDHISYKDAQRKNWLTQQCYFASIKEGFARVKGYIKGVFKTSLRYIPNFIAATLALALSGNAARDRWANISAVALGVIEGVDFVKNTLAVNQRDDYLNVK